MRGPHRLDSETVSRIVRRRSPGAYLLGHKYGGAFVEDYVGRSDDDVRGRLLQWVGYYYWFKYEYTSSARAAFYKECSLYHYHGGAQGHLDNEYHPRRPDYTNWRCPVCGRFG